MNSGFRPAALKTRPGMLAVCASGHLHIDAAKNVTALLKRIIVRLRQTWPQVPIIVRGDSGFRRQRPHALVRAERRGLHSSARNYTSS